MRGYGPCTPLHPPEPLGCLPPCPARSALPMPSLEALDLARIQFGFTIAFHIVFPALTIGLASYLAVLEARWLLTRDSVFHDLYH